MGIEPGFASEPEADKKSESQNFFSRLIGIWFSPGETFAEIGSAPQILAPLITLMILGGLTAFIMVHRVGVRGIVSPGIEKNVANGRISREDADKQIDTIESGVAGTIIKVTVPLVGLLQAPILALILVGVAKLIAMLMGGDNEFKPLFSISIHALLSTGLVSSGLIILLLFLKQPEDIDINNLIGSNLAALLGMTVGKDALPKFIMALARWVDVFAVWLIALLSIGYAAVTRRVKVSSYGTALGGIYIVIALIAAAWTAMMG